MRTAAPPIRSFRLAPTTSRCRYQLLRPRALAMFRPCAIGSPVCGCNTNWLIVKTCDPPAEMSAVASRSASSRAEIPNSAACASGPSARLTSIDIRRCSQPDATGASEHEGPTPMSRRRRLGYGFLASRKRSTSRNRA